MEYFSAELFPVQILELLYLFHVYMNTIHGGIRRTSRTNPLTAGIYYMEEKQPE